MSRIENEDREAIEVEAIDEVPTGQIALPRFGAGTRNDLSRTELATLSLSDENLASIAHDFRNPLSVVELETQRLRQLLPSFGMAAAEPALARIIHNVAFMAGMLDNILDLSRADAGRLGIELERADLAKLVTTVIDRAVPTHDRERIVIELRDPASARVDSARIERVIENLLRNALTHAPAHSPIVVRLEVFRGRAQISVIDSGPGLSREDADRVFVRYWQGADALGHHGHGLGLHVSRKIIEAHDGRLEVDSAPGIGCRFYFELPTV